VQKSLRVLLPSQTSHAENIGAPCRRASFVCAVVYAALAFLAGPAYADKRIALVVGNSAYEHATRLDQPANDARLMAETLRTLGRIPRSQGISIL